MRLGFIGAGNMAGAIIAGVVSQNETSSGLEITSSNITIFDLNTENVTSLSQNFGIVAAQSAQAVVENSDYIVLAVKPQALPGLISEIKDQVNAKSPVIVSIAAGTSLETLNELFGSSQLPIIRVMPNVNVAVGSAMSALTQNGQVADNDFEQVKSIFDAVGETVVLPEKNFSAFTALAGSSPAYVLLFIDAMSRAGVEAGIPKAQATFIATQAVLGSAKLALNNPKSPWDLIDTVCSPGGTTIAGLLALEDRSFISTVVHGIRETIKRDQELGK